MLDLGRDLADGMILIATQVSDFPIGGNLRSAEGGCFSLHGCAGGSRVRSALESVLVDIDDDRKLGCDVRMCIGLKVPRGWEEDNGGSGGTRTIMMRSR